VSRGGGCRARALLAVGVLGIVAAAVAGIYTEVLWFQELHRDIGRATVLECSDGSANPPGGTRGRSGASRWRRPPISRRVIITRAYARARSEVMSTPFDGPASTVRTAAEVAKRVRRRRDVALDRQRHPRGQRVNAGAKATSVCLLPV